MAALANSEIHLKSNKTRDLLSFAIVVYAVKKIKSTLLES
jgi:hypothetical protein